jgi:hypothetical protein
MAGDEILQLTQSDPPALLEEGMGPFKKQHAGGFVVGVAHYLVCDSERIESE